jgi:NAD(P)-dependent dehydrogenase (short-subunit alcohol dehydrogenase family)
MPLNPPIRDWRGRRVWIVGGSTGIGAATAERLLDAGARVAVSARSADRLEARFARHAGCLRLPADVLDVASLEAGLKAIVAQWGGLDLAIACAGTYREMRASAPERAAARDIWRTNFEGAFNVYATCLPQWMSQGGGALALVSSAAGYTGLPNSLAYGASKAALINLAESLWLDLARHGIAVTLINPGFVDTPLTAKNRFRMPAIISAEQAADAILRGFARGAFEIDFPRRFTWSLKLVARLPHALRFWCIRRFTGA